MSIDAKGIQLFVWKIIRFSGSCCYKFVRTYPLVSGILIFVLFLYISFPSVFYFLMYSSPILVCTAVSIRFYVKTKYPEFQWIKKKQGSERSCADIVNRSNDPLLRPQKSVRRNARKEVMEWDRKDSEDRDILFPRSPYDSLLHRTNFLEENPKVIFEGKGRPGMEHGESSSHIETGNDQAVGDPNVLFDSETWKRPSVSPDGFQGQSGKVRDGSVGEVEVESFEEGEDEEDDGNKAVQWTADDQKNLMDLGFSELERNRRLESLIAKRRARKLFKMAIEKSLMNKDNCLSPSQIAPILTIKNNLLAVSDNPDEEGLQMPSSAPSILLPAKNPFDLPYDPLEEKPNLMADSFHQEFMAANQKDMFLCRHESFCRGPVFTLETTQDPDSAHFNPYCSTEKQPGEDRAVSGFKRQSAKGGHHQHNASDVGSNTDLAELEDSNQNEAIKSSEVKHKKTIESANNRVDIGEKMVSSHDLEPGLDTRSEVRMETDSIKNNDSCYSSSSEATDELNQSKSSIQIISDHVRKTFNLSVPPKGKSMHRPPYDSSPSPSDKRRTDLALYCTARRLHTPTLSIASDLQVEVSEIGSPPTTDGTVSSVDGDSVTYDGDVDRDINSDNEEIWGGSFNLTREEANRAKQRELLHDIGEKHSAKVEFSGLNRKPKEPIALPSPSEQDAMQNLNSTISLSSRTVIAETGASPPTNLNRERHEDLKQRDEDNEGCKTLNVSDTLSPENPEKTMHLMETSPSQSCFGKPEQEVEPQHKPTEDSNIFCDVKPVTDGDANNLHSQSSENMENGTEMLMQPAALGEARKQSEAINLDSSEFKRRNLETSYESKSTTEAEKEGQPSRHIEEDTPNLTEYAPDAVQSRDDLTSVPDSIDDQNVTEGNFAGLEQRFGRSVARALNPRLVIPQISVSSDASPRSVLPQRILADQIPISDVQQRIQTDVQQSAMEDIVRDNLADDQPHENPTLDLPQNAQPLVEHSMDPSSSNYRILEGSSNMTEKTADNHSTVHNMNELVEDTYGKEDFSIKSNEGSVEHHEGGSEKLIKYDSRIGPLTSEEGNANSDVPESMKPTNSPKEVIEEGNIVNINNNSVVNEKEEGAKLTTIDGESQFSIKPEAIMGPEKSIEDEADVNKTEGNESDNTSISETAREGEKFAAEVDNIHNVNGSFADNVTNEETLNRVVDGEGDLLTLSTQEAVIEPSNTTTETSAGSVEDTEQDSKRLLDAEANPALSTSAEESNGLNNIKNGEEMQILTGQEGVLNAPEAGEDNIKAVENTPDVGDITTDTSIDQKAAAEASNARESEVRAVNPEEDDSSAVSN